MLKWFSRGGPAIVNHERFPIELAILIQELYQEFAHYPIKLFAIRITITAKLVEYVTLTAAKTTVLETATLIICFLKIVLQWSTGTVVH